MTDGPANGRQQEDRSQLGGWIRTVRMKQGLSQRELADRSGLSRSYVCDIERGRGTHPSVESIDKLAAALGYSRVDLLRASGVIEAAGPRENDDERRMLAIYRDLTDAGRMSVLRFARFVHADEHQWVQGALIDGGAEITTGVPAGMKRLFDFGDD